MNFPFEENKTEGVYIRKFSNVVDESELVWHRDKEDRIVESIGDTDWMIQLDNQLPISLTDRVYIPKEIYHRVIMGSGELIVKIKKLDD
jgi:hypothetical protein